MMKGVGIVASIFKDSQGYWNAQVDIGHYANGKRKYKRFRAETKKEVQKKLDEYMLDTKNLAIIPEDDKVLTGEYIERYINIFKTNSLKPSSLTRDRGILKNQIDPFIGGFALNKLTPTIIQQHLINQLRDKDYSYSTIHKAYTLLNEAMKKAVDENKIIKNPCSGVELPSKSNIKPKEIEILTDEECKLFLESVYADKFDNALAIGLVLYTGLRCGELCALRVEDINFENKRINVHRNVSVSYETGKRMLSIQEGTKTKPRREVPLNETSVHIISMIIAKNHLRNSDLLIRTRSEIPDVSTVSNTYNNMLKYSGIKGKTGIHTLRHTFASKLIRNGMDIKMVSEILGHSSYNFTYNTYIHFLPKDKDNILDGLEY